MLFNSSAFLFGFFPITVLVFFLLGRTNATVAGAWLAVASLFFYGWWSIKALPLLLLSVCFNYAVGILLTTDVTSRQRYRRVVLFGAVFANLALLGFFKYANFFIANTNFVLDGLSRSAIQPLDIVLPIGISFYTFTQIAFLVDCWQRKVVERNFVHYLLFVSYFPHLIAGPVLHHKQMMPQFAKPSIYRPCVDTITIGVAIFILGLSKKLLLADPLGGYADVVFEDARLGVAPSLIKSWLGTLAYTLQIYFDFSGYSDMAIGLSLVFGIRLPINFNSPYKANNIIDFWRRWHMTLSAFLRDYLYIPLGGNRNGPTGRYMNLLVTMLLGGLWHGANWTFVLWGLAHGVLLMINHLWRQIRSPRSNTSVTYITRVTSWTMTFVCVTLTWVLFRSDNAATAGQMYKGMIGLGLPLSLGELTALPAIMVLIAIVAWLPNSQQLVGYTEIPKCDVDPARQTPVFKPITMVALSMLLALCLLLIKEPSPFLYFQF